MTKEDVLQKAVLENQVLILPEIQLDRKLYQEVAKAIEGIGGKWNKKFNGFVFDSNLNLQEKFERIQGGESVNLKKEFQFFPTPEKIAKKMVDLLELNPNSFYEILEPSAGKGNLVKAISENGFKGNLTVVELNKDFEEYLKNLNIDKIIISDFLELDFDDSRFDRIIANPPFTKNQDIDHIKRMYDLLNENGILVSCSSKHWKISNNKKETEFRNWLEEVNAEIIEVESGEFKESGTMIATCIIRIKK